MAEKVKIIFLGTAAQIPTSKRNHTAIFLQYKEDNILVDCGEGTQRQFRKAKINPGKITRILITHFHGDHILGLPGLISTLGFSEYNKTLNIYGPKGIKEFVNNFLKYSKSEPKFKIVVEEVSGKFFQGKDFYLEAEKMNHGTPTNAYSFVIEDKLRMDKSKLKKSKLPLGKHISELQSGKDIVFDGKKYKSKELTYIEKGKKVSFVLDTLMNERIENFVKDSDLLILESSFGSDLEKEAKEHMHLTAEQCGKIAKKSKSKKLLLTHISQRYEKDLNFLLKDAKKNFSKVEIVKDFDSFEI